MFNPSRDEVRRFFCEVWRKRQAGELSELSVALAKESIKPVQESVTKSFAGFSKAAAA